MKNELGITKGNISRGLYKDKLIQVDADNPLLAYTICGVWGNDEVANADADFIVEAFNVANETGKTPRQLADDNKVLLEALKELLTHALEYDLHGHFTDNAEQAIKQVTE